MKPIRLNLAHLRGTIHDGEHSERWTRRRWLGLTGSAAVVSAPVLGRLDAMLFGSFACERSASRIVFRVQGEERWVIDTRRFAGSPKLAVEQERHRIRVELRSARIPGTPVPADFTAVMTEGLFGWSIALSIPFGGFTAECRFVPWLCGTEELASDVTVPSTIIRSFPDTFATLAGPGRASFTPDWSLDLTGDALASASGLGAPVVADVARLRLAAPSEDPVAHVRSPRWSVLALERGTRQWSITPAGFEPHGWTFSTNGSPFDRLRFEHYEPREGVRSFALFGEGGGSDLRVHRGMTLAHPDGQPFGLPLREVRYAMAGGRGEGHAAVIGRFGTDPVWMMAGSAGLLVADGPDARPFELVREGSALRSEQCAPALLRVAVPLPDAVVEPVAPAGGTHLDLSMPQQIQKQNVQSKVPQRAQIKLPTNVEASLKLTLPNPTVSVIRPEDMLRLDFDFRNLSLTMSGGRTELVRTKTSAPASIILRLPPQNIAEQAFYESSGPGYGTPGILQIVKNSPDTPTIPAKSRLAGPSRLVFVVPGNVQSIEYSLEALLIACTQYPLSVSPAASVLTAQQRAMLKPLVNFATRPSVVASMTSASAATYAGGGKNVSTKPYQAPPSGARVQAGAAKSAMRSLPALYQPREAAMKRMETLQNAIDRAATYAPESAQAYAVTLQRVSDKWKSTSGDELIDVGFLTANPFVVIKPSPAEPTDEQTSIEAPYRLIISPHGYSGWAHAAKALKVNGRYELWHTRLGVRGTGSVSESISKLRTVRAVWSPDMAMDPANGPKHVEGGPPNDDGNPFRLSVDRQDRHEIVHLTSNFQLPAPYEPLPVDVNHLMLTSLGAWLNVRGAWEPPEHLSVQSWTHRATMGRDHYVRLVYAGYLFPFGHRVSLLKVTERKFQRYGDQMAAFLRQRMFIIVREPVKTYPGTGQDGVTSGTKDARTFPFRTVRVTTLITPNLDSPKNTEINSMGQGCFWPQVGGKDFSFHLVAQDWDGNEVEFAMPFIYVDKGAMDDATLTALFGKPEKNIFWNYVSNIDRRTVDLRGQRIAFADSHTPGDTTFETSNILFAFDRNWDNRKALSDDYHPWFYPTVQHANIRIMAVEQLTGNPASQAIEYVDAFRKSGFDAAANAGEVFAKFLKEVPVDFLKDTSKAGAFFSPNLNISGLSRTVGTIAGTVDKMISGQFDPTDYFKGMLDKVKLFGSIPLTDILDKIDDFSNLLDRVPKLLNVSTPDAFDTSYAWKPKLTEITSGPLKGVFVPNDKDNGFVVKVHAHMALDGSPPSVEVSAELNKFDIHLIPSIVEVVVVRFDGMSLSMVAGEKLDLDVKLNRVDFVGPLSFVNTLREYIPMDGFSDPPGIDVTTEGITASFSIGLPTISVGMFSLQNISLGAGLEIPFIGKPLAAKFNFCERENPFILTVSLFGGGGFFNIVLTPGGIALMEAAFEFGGALSLNLGVASGGVSVMAGIYYKKDGDVTSLEGYFRVDGCMEVLGLISISVTFYMGLTYQSNGKVYGQAEVKVKVEVLFFSTSVTLHTERQLKGSAGDPHIIDIYPTVDAYTHYLNAFAA